MKSLIDWNELIPKLPKKVRDDLYLEAVTFLSEGGKRESREDPVPVFKARKKPKRLKGTPYGYRLWRDQGDGHILAAPGRKYKIHKNKNYKGRGESSAVRNLWDKLRASHNDVITYEGVASIYTGIPHTPKFVLSTAIATLWSHRYIDVVVDDNA